MVLKLKYRVKKIARSFTKGGGNAGNMKKTKALTLRPRRKAYGPF